MTTLVSPRKATRRATRASATRARVKATRGRKARRGRRWVRVKERVSRRKSDQGSGGRGQDSQQSAFLTPDPCLLVHRGVRHAGFGETLLPQQARVAVPA